MFDWRCGTMRPKLEQRRQCRLLRRCAVRALANPNGEQAATSLRCAAMSRKSCRKTRENSRARRRCCIQTTSTCAHVCPERTVAQAFFQSLCGGLEGGTMPNDSQFSEETWTELLNLIELQKVVPIVGRALSLVDAGDGHQVPVLNAILVTLAQQLSIAPRDPPWTLSELFVESARTTRYSADSFHLMLRKELDAATPVAGPLEQLADITDFKLFLSTGIDGFLEKAVSKVRGATGEPTRAIAFAPDGYYDLPGRLEDTEGVTVFKLLGGRETCPNWVVTVENALEFVIALHGEKYRPANLLDSIKDRHLLAIGCQIPDWLGRFFLRCLRGGPISAQRSTNFLVDNVADTDVAFGEYLKQFSKSSFVVGSDAV